MSSLLVRMVTTITLMVAVPSMRQYSGRLFVSIVRTEAFVPVRRYTPSMRVVGSTNHAAQQRHNHTSSSSTLQHNNSPRHIRILGGGLAGLSMAYHLLSLLQQQQQPSRFDITIYDTAHEIGTGGASAVAGGLLHPLSPRGKLVHWALEGLTATNAMIDAAVRATSSGTVSLPTISNTGIDAPCTIRLRHELFRIPMSDEQKTQLQEIASLYPSIAEWRNRIGESTTNTTTTPWTNSEGSNPTGGLRLHNGCCVVHVPSYLRGVYQACEILARNTGSSIRWCHIEKTESGHLEPQDDVTTIYCYGSNMFQRSDNHHSVFDSASRSTSSEESDADGAPTRMSLPVQLVRGQSMEVTLAQPLEHALLCGKYISPLPQEHADHHRALIGATHEFSSIPMSPAQVTTDLQTRTQDFCPFGYPDAPSDPNRTDHSLTLTNHVTCVDRITSGYRVQSTRGDYGRRPIIGRLPVDNHWIFTGLSSRGLLYHALYGQLLAQAIVQNDESLLLDSCPDILWWKSKNEESRNRCKK